MYFSYFFNSSPCTKCIREFVFNNLVCLSRDNFFRIVGVWILFSSLVLEISNPVAISEARERIFGQKRSMSSSLSHTYVCSRMSEEWNPHIHNNKKSLPFSSRDEKFLKKSPWLCKILLISMMKLIFRLVSLSPLFLRKLIEKRRQSCPL